MFRRTMLVATLSAAVLASTAPVASAQEPSPLSDATQTVVGTTNALVGSASTTLNGAVGEVVTGATDYFSTAPGS